MSPARTVKPALRVIHVSPEGVPFSKTGGLADVAGTLPLYLRRLGVEAQLFLPLHKASKSVAKNLVDTGVKVEVAVGDRLVTGGVYKSAVPGADLPVYFIAQDDYFHRDGLYGNSEGDYPDNSERFIFFARAVLEAIRALGLRPDVVHCHDWQSALIPVYIRTVYKDDPVIGKLNTVLTVHNLAYQGVFWHWDMKLTGLDWSVFNWQQLEFYGKMNFLKGGLTFADRLTTVSPRYAQEIQTEEFGCGLNGVLQQRSGDLAGIVNGINPDEWNPETDPLIPTQYTPANLRGKVACKQELCHTLGIPVPKGLLLGFVGRLAEQKGLDLVVGCFDELMKTDNSIVILGTGDERYHRALSEKAAKHPEKVSLTLGFDNRLAHQIEAASDAFLMPSHFEPCGLNQLYSLRYGSMPIVRETGGLADTVVDATPANIKKGKATGVVFKEYTAKAFFAAIQRARGLYESPATWKKIVKTGMAQDWSWTRSAKEYHALYAGLVLKAQAAEQAEAAAGER